MDLDIEIFFSPNFHLDYELKLETIVLSNNFQTESSSTFLVYGHDFIHKLLKC